MSCAAHFASRAADKIGRQSQQPIWLIFRPAILDGDVPALDESASLRPCRSALTRYSNPAAGVDLRNPTTGVAGCCARAVSGHAVAEPAIPATLT